MTVMVMIKWHNNKNDDDEDDNNDDEVVLSCPPPFALTRAAVHHSKESLSHSFNQQRLISYNLFKRQTNELSRKSLFLSVSLAGRHCQCHHHRCRITVGSLWWPPKLSLVLSSELKAVDVVR